MGVLVHLATKGIKHAIMECAISILVLVILTAACYRLHLNLTTTSLLYVIVIVLVARLASFVPAVVVSITAAMLLAYIAPPAGSLSVDDPLDVVAVSAFLVTAFVISKLVSRLRRMREEALSSVNRALIDTEERERARIARDLHDDIGQRMALLAIKFEELRTDVPNAAPTADVVTIDELVKELAETSRDIQVLAHTMHSPKLEYLGLVKTARSFCKEFGNQHKLEIDFRSTELPNPLPIEVSLSLFRILQEALHNSAKHSGARQVAVELFETQDTVQLIVRDSGQGFDLQTAVKNRGLGLISMQERIKLVKGELSIDSQPMRGTTICARVPTNSVRSSAFQPLKGVL
jgi:signal transduction histidine kinase